MKISPQEISTSDKFHLTHVLSYDNIAPFVFSNIKKFNLATFAFYFLNILFVAIGIIAIVIFVSSDFFTWKYTLLNLILGFLIYPILLIPVHELVHAIIYKLIGAPKIKFGIDLSQYIFYIAADNFAVNFKELLWVAVAPFIFISGLAFLAFQLFQGPFAISFILTLIAHGTMCIGDFAVLSFFMENDHKKVITFDNVEEKKAFFYKTLTN